jgi:hypothetical protein
MSHSESDPTIHWINEATASMGGSVHSAGGDRVAIPTGQSIEPVAEMEGLPGVVLEDDGFSAYCGLADELLIEVGRTVPADVRDELARHIGSGIVSSLLRHDSPKKDLASITDGVLLEARAGLLSGSLLSELQEITDFAAEARANANMGPIARWRHKRRLAAEEAAAARQRYTERQDELRRLRHRTFDQGAVPMQEGMQPGDTVTLDLGNQYKNASAASSQIHGRVVGHVDDEPLRWDGGRATRGVVIEVHTEERANPDNFIYDELPNGAHIVLYGTALTGNNYMRDEDRGFMVRDQTPIVGWEGEALKIVTRSTDDRYAGGKRLKLNQVTINEVTMFTDTDS